MSAPLHASNNDGNYRSASSFRDPNSHVLVDEEVTRVFEPRAAKTIKDFLDSPTFGSLVGRGDIETPLTSTLNSTGQLLLTHREIPLWNYPWEWTWSMLRDAALLHLEMLQVCAADNWTMSDATSFNIVFTDGRPIFIDHGSFVRRTDDEPWWAYTQFCEHFLYPLMVAAHTGAQLAPLLRGGFGRVSLNDAHALLKTNKRRRGVVKYVLLPYQAANRSDMSVDEVSESASAMTTEIYKNILRGLHSTITKLEAPGGVSTWSGYANRDHYTGSALSEKGEFIDRVTAATRPATVLDIGANDGHFSEIAAQHAERVIAADGDPLVVDRLYVSGSAKNVLPLVQDATNPSPSMGWRSCERTGFFDRVQPDLVLALAVFHHVVFTGNVPVSQLGVWMSEINADFIVEFVHREDQKVQHLLKRKTDPETFSYDLDSFLESTSPYFSLIEKQTLSSGTRSMLHLSRLGIRKPSVGLSHMAHELEG